MTNRDSSWDLRRDWNAIRMLSENAPLVLDIYLFYKGMLPSWVRNIFVHWSQKAETYVLSMEKELGFNPFYTFYEAGVEKICHVKKKQFDDHFIHGLDYKQDPVTEQHGDVTLSISCSHPADLIYAFHFT